MGVRAVHEGLFRLTDGSEPRLLAGRCGSCQRLHFPLAAICPYCSTADPEETEVAGRGVLWAWTAVTAPPPGYLGEVPYGFGVVELDEGLRVVTRLTEADPARLRFGQPMHLEIVPLHSDDDATVVTYAFAPDGGGG